MAEELVPRTNEGGGLTAEEERSLVEEMKAMEYIPLMSVEKKLIGYSLGLGIVLLFVFIWISQTYFPGQN
ncbi:MAG: hypothetical protein AB1646_00580 [Thermodesulfobacteriota bacterium]